MTSTKLTTQVPGGKRLLTAAEFHRLADVPPEVEWYAMMVADGGGMAGCGDRAANARCRACGS